MLEKKLAKKVVKRISRMFLWIMFLGMVLNFTACSDNDESTKQIDLAGGCWVCAQNDYNDMLEFATDGTVTSNGVKGDETWGLTGTYQFAGNILSMDFGSERREGSVNVIDDNSFIFTDDMGSKSYDRRYPPTFDEVLGWEWNWASTLFIKQVLKDELVTPEKTYTVDEWLLNVETVMKDFFSKAQFTQESFVLANVDFRSVSGTSFDYQYQDGDIVVISFGRPGESYPVVAQVKFFANGKMALYFVNEQCYKFLAFIMNITRASDQEYDELEGLIAETFSQLVLCVSFERQS